MANTKVKAEQLEAAQTNITSLGTLTALQVDNLNLNGNTISSTDTNGNITIAPNGTGDIYANTDKMIVLAAEGESATLMIVSDESDDNGDDWSFVANQSNNTLTIDYIQIIPLLVKQIQYLTNELSILKSKIEK